MLFIHNTLPLLMWSPNSVVVSTLAVIAGRRGSMLSHDARPDSEFT